jgi:PTH1 family peptidyl-tRNA hydrolase
MFMIVGLGNPGREYDDTRHNIGFAVIDELVRSNPLATEKTEKKALTYKVKIGTESCLLVKPQTYMNLSGESVVPLMSYYKVPPEKLLVIHDDIDMAFCQMKLQSNRGHGGQNGIRNIHQLLGHNKYMRLKMGVGRPSHPRQDVASWVLSKFKNDEQSDLQDFLSRATDAVTCFVKEGPKQAMEIYNQKTKG